MAGGGDLCRKVSSITDHFSCASTYSKLLQRLCHATYLILRDGAFTCGAAKDEHVRSDSIPVFYRPKLRAKNNPEK